MKNSFSSLIENANSVLILLPTKPTFDQVAGALGLYLSLKDTKTVSISCPSPMVVDFNRLVGVDKISTELGDKNLTLRFPNYDAENIERVSYDIENGEFKLTVIPKPGFVSPKKDQIDINYSGVASDTVILIGGKNESHFPAISSKNLLGANLVHIGTRVLEVSADKSILSFARPASSTAELIGILIAEMGLSYDHDIATNLLMGLEQGSLNFTGSDVTADTFQLVANLLRAGGVRIPRGGELKGNFPVGSIPGQKLPEEPEKKEQPPQDWLEPKIYKGTSIS